jgi:hypothetical protein
MFNLQEQAYFEGFSSYKPTDDTWWDLWIILWSSDFCCGEYLSKEAAETELKRLKSTAKNVEFRIEHVPNAGYGDQRRVGGWRYFSSPSWYP